MRPEVEKNELNVNRPHTLPEFIMDVITREAKRYGNIKLSRVQSAIPEATFRDTALLKPWDKAKERVARMQLLDQDHSAQMDLELRHVQAHVEAVFLKASYAYKIDPEGGFAFCVAMTDVGYIKARSQGPSKAVSHAFYDKFTIRKSLFN